VPPAGVESAYRSAEVTGDLRNWAKIDGRGRVLDSNVQFLLGDGSAMSPDAAWVSMESLQRLTGRQRKQFLALCPEFIVEVLSPSDRLKLKDAKAKMQRWIANGVQLGVADRRRRADSVRVSRGSPGEDAAWRGGNRRRRSGGRIRSATPNHLERAVTIFPLTA